MRRLLVAAVAALALALACVTGELRGGVAEHDGGDTDVAGAADLFEALPPAVGPQLAPPPSSGEVFLDLPFPLSRMTTAEVFRPPQARG
jgi:hypothetical protein